MVARDRGTLQALRQTDTHGPCVSKLASVARTRHPVLQRVPSIQSMPIVPTAAPKTRLRLWCLRQCIIPDRPPPHGRVAPPLEAVEQTIDTREDDNNQQTDRPTTHVGTRRPPAFTHHGPHAECIRILAPNCTRIVIVEPVALLAHCQINFFVSVRPPSLLSSPNNTRRYGGRVAGQAGRSHRQVGVRHLKAQD